MIILMKIKLMRVRFQRMVLVYLFQKEIKSRNSKEVVVRNTSVAQLIAVQIMFGVDRN
jgi:hypothetical protein